MLEFARLRTTEAHDSLRFTADRGISDSQRALQGAVIALARAAGAPDLPTGVVNAIAAVQQHSTVAIDVLEAVKALPQSPVQRGLYVDAVRGQLTRNLDRIDALRERLAPPPAPEA